jgi:16S rRNA (adenine1518-N6/adenine1519-N6)-dimethyltransferase
MMAHRAKKSLGQNFLVDPNQQRRIVDALDVTAADTVIEIGPGQGALTQHLALRAGRLVLVELDNELAPSLRARYADQPHVTVVHADFMDVDLAALVDDVRAVKVVGNIPYNITTPIIFRLLERAIRPSQIVLMIQKEVADRILAPAGSGEYGALSVGVRSVAKVERLFNVSREAFRPVPRVMSSVIRITPHQPPPLSDAEERDLRELTRAAFSWRRKQLQKILRSSPEYMLSQDDIAVLESRLALSLTARPEDLTPEQLATLASSLRQIGKPGARAA